MEKASILIVENETIIALELKNNILELGYDVTDSVTNCKDALRSISENPPDLVFMDIDLGKNRKNGIETVKEIKKILDVPVVYITAFSDEDTIQKAAETLPVNYLLKPYRIEDIKSTIILSIYKLKQKRFVNKNDFIDMGEDYYFDQNNDRLYYKEKLIVITAQEKVLINLLIHSRGNVVTYESILNNVWEGKDISSSSLRTLIYRLRNKLNFKLIETVHSAGIKLAGV